MFASRTKAAPSDSVGFYFMPPGGQDFAWHNGDNNMTVELNTLDQNDEPTTTSDDAAGFFCGVSDTKFGGWSLYVPYNKYNLNRWPHAPHALQQLQQTLPAAAEVCVCYTQNPGKPLAITAKVTSWHNEVEWKDNYYTSEHCLVCALTDEQKTLLLAVAEAARDNHSQLMTFF